MIATVVKKILLFVWKYKEAIAIGLLFLLFAAMVFVLGLGEQGDLSSSSSCGSTPGVYSAPGTYVQNDFDSGGYNVSIAKTALATVQAYSKPVSTTVEVALFETGIVESNFRNIANDGINHNGEDSGSTASQLAEAATSLKIPHDTSTEPWPDPTSPGKTVGSDHASVGFLQQQAVQGFGYGTPADAMNTGHAANIFLQRATGKNPSDYGDTTGGSLKGIDAATAAQITGRLAQSVQVSATPDAYATQYAAALKLISEAGGGATLPLGSISTDTTGCSTNSIFAIGSVVSIHEYGNDPNCKAASPTDPVDQKIVTCNSGPVYQIPVPSDPVVGTAIARALDMVQAHYPYSWGGGSWTKATTGQDESSHLGGQTVGFDCSGLVSYAYGTLLKWDKYFGGSRTDTDGELNWGQTNRLTFSDTSQLQPGDILLHFENGATEHTAIFLGNLKTAAGTVEPMIVEAPKSGDYVKVDVTYPLNGGYWSTFIHPLASEMK